MYVFQHGIIASSNGGGATPNPLWDGLLAYYTADNTPNDALGTYNGTLTNGATYGTGIINQGFSLDGINDYVSLPNNMFKPLNDFSVNAWINMNGTATGTILGNQNDNYGFRIDISSFNKVFFRFFDSSGLTYSFTSTGSITRGLNQMITITKDSVNGTKVYINGVYDSMSPITTNVGYKLINPTYTNIGIIQNPGSFSQPFNGRIDEVSLYNTTVITPTQVTELYNSGAGLQYPN